MPVTRCSLVGFACILASCEAALNFTGFEPLPNPPQDFTVLEFGITCPVDSNFVGKVSNIHWIVQPVETDAVEILTFPPFLVDATAQDGILRFTYNSVSMFVHQMGAGVLIKIPQDQLEGILGAPGEFFKAKVLRGFTKLSSVTQEGDEAFLVVLMNGTDTPFKVSDKGRANTLYLGADVIVEAEVSGSGSSVLIDGTLTKGTLSGSNCVLWATEAIEQLSVTGDQNKVLTSGSNVDGEACKNVVFQLERNVCDLMNTEIPIPDVSVPATDELLLSCNVTKTTAESMSDGTCRTSGKASTFAVAFLAFILHTLLW